MTANVHLKEYLIWSYLFSVIQKAVTASVSSFAWYKSFFSQEIPLEHIVVYGSSLSVFHRKFVFSSLPKMFHFLSVVSHRLSPVLVRFHALYYFSTIYSTFFYTDLYFFYFVQCFVLFLSICWSPPFSFRIGRIVEKEAFFWI